MRKPIVLMCVLISIVMIAGCSTTYKVNPPSSTTTTTTAPTYMAPGSTTSSTTTSY